MTLKYLINENKISFLQNLGENSQVNDLEYKIDGDNLIIGELNLVKK